MPVAVKEESYYALNAAADAAGMDRREFRKLIGPFEMRAGKLPLRLNDQGTESKCIPSAFLHVFEEAAIWMNLDKVSEDTAIATALNLRRPNHFFHKLNLDIEAQKRLLELPAKLLATATAVETRLKTPVSVRVEASHLQPALGEIEKRVASRNWEAVAGIALAGVVFGSFISAAVMRVVVLNQFGTFNARINDSQYQEQQHFEALSRQLRARR